MLEMFHEFLDQVYWAGYASQLFEDDFIKYSWELTEFSKIYE